MDRIIRNAVGALRLRRETYLKLLWDDYATADAVLIVVSVSLVQLVVALVAGLSPLALIQGLVEISIQELIRWMVAALIMWAVATKLLKANGRIPATVGVTGYAYLPFVFAPIAKMALGFAGLGTAGIFVDIVASFWFGLGLLIVGQVLFDLSRDKAVAAALLSVVGWWIVTLILV